MIKDEKCQKTKSLVNFLGPEKITFGNEIQEIAKAARPSRKISQNIGTVTVTAEGH